MLRRLSRCEATGLASVMVFSLLGATACSANKTPSPEVSTFIPAPNSPEPSLTGVDRLPCTTMNEVSSLLLSREQIDGVLAGQALPPGMHGGPGELDILILTRHDPIGSVTHPHEDTGDPSFIEISGVVKAAAGQVQDWAEVVLPLLSDPSLPEGSLKLRLANCA